MSSRVPTSLAGRTVPAPLRAALVIALLYVFLIGVALLESGISAMGEGFTQGLLDGVSNPLAGLFAGILFTVLVQSSSVSTSAIVGLVGAGTIPLELAVPMIMGANIGTTVTSTLASLGSIRRPDEFRRAFGVATVHDMFNVISVAVLLPLELATGVLSRAALWLTGILRDTSGTEIGRSPIRTAVKVPVEAITSRVEQLVSAGPVLGTIYLVLGLTAIFLALGLITRNMRQLVAGGVERAMNRAIGRGGGSIGILVGILVTFAVQSSTITTSILVPLVAAGVITLRNAYPITLGANVGTTITALLASLAVLQPAGLTIALVHTLFNLVAITLIYPVAAVRFVPVRLAEGLGDLAVDHRWIAIVYSVGLFIVIPVVGLILLN